MHERRFIVEQITVKSLFFNPQLSHEYIEENLLLHKFIIESQSNSL